MSPTRAWRANGGGEGGRRCWVSSLTYGFYFFAVTQKSSSLSESGPKNACDVVLLSETGEIRAKRER